METVRPLCLIHWVSQRVWELSFRLKTSRRPKQKSKQLEKKINDLLEESVFAAQRQEYNLALEKAKDSVQKERSLSRMKEQSGLAETIAPNSDLTFAVLFNLAVQYTNSEMYSEAINTYQSIIKNRTFTNTGLHLFSDSVI